MSSISVVRKKRGRPPTGQDPVTAIRLSPDMRDAVDAWAARQKDSPSRSEAIRRLVDLGLRKGKR
ncbi:MAG: ribbon-helix-helix protein, CopG family [Parvibaculaceae bacterium]